MFYMLVLVSQMHVWFLVWANFTNDSQPMYNRDSNIEYMSAAAAVFIVGEFSSTILVKGSYYCIIPFMLLSSWKSLQTG